MTDLDIVLTEGYRRGNAPKIEVSRRERSSTLMCRSDELLAIVSNQHFDLNVPQYGLDDVADLVDLIEAHFLTAD
jgi:molybdopterin-guanine dinucleotide biosynthesis protein B